MSSGQRKYNILNTHYLYKTIEYFPNIMYSLYKAGYAKSRNCLNLRLKFGYSPVPYQNY